MRELQNSEMNVTSSTSQLPPVDLESDPRMCAMLEEVCNATVHTTAWANAADHPLSQQGRKLGPVRGKPRRYTGLGGAMTSGHRLVPCGIRVFSAPHLKADVKSWEISKTDKYMWLWLQAQATLGIVKDAAAGRWWFKEFGDHCQWHEVRFTLVGHLHQ